MAFKAFIFDLDGTIWDSYPCYGAALGSINGCGNENIVEKLRHGANLITLAKSFGVSNSRLVKLCECEYQAFRLYMRVLEVLKLLKLRGVGLGIATNLPGWFAKPLIMRSGLAELFTAYAFAARKPHPSGLSKVIARLGTTPEDKILFVGDSEADLKAAKAAKISFVWASYGYGSKPTEDHSTISKFEQILEL